MKIGLLSMRLAGHLHPMTALGRKMKARRHEVTFFGLPDAARIVHDARGCLSWIIKRICGGQSRCSFARAFLDNRSEKDRSIWVNTISPGYTETSIFETLDDLLAP
ncbi:MAG TPA: hypothetical protein VK638_50255 [Edaphobacter sp.]|nr:hypothetical protein [Edaphobacter sp.]